MNQPPKKTYLTIQKTIKLLSAENLEFLKQHLELINAQLPLKLIQAIKPGFDDNDSLEELCERVYGVCDDRTRKAFHQLASHTLQQTSYLSKNFPDYLNHNIGKADILLAKGKLEEANLLMECLIDIAERIGNLSVQISCLKFFSHQAMIYNNRAESIRHHEQIAKLLEYEMTMNSIYLHFKTYFDPGKKDGNIQNELEKHLNYFEKYHRHEFKPIALLSKYCARFITYYFLPDGKNDLHSLKQLISDIQKNDLLVFPLLEDLLSKSSYLFLNNSNIDFVYGENKGQFEKLKKHSVQVDFWKNYNSMPLMLMIAIKSTYYFSRYHIQIHKTKYENIIPDKELKDIEELIQYCESLLQKEELKTRFIHDFIRLQITYSVLLMMSSYKNIKKGLDELESLMITFQQNSFSYSIDSIIASLMVGYFALSDYKKCTSTYERYVKLAKGRILNTENDIDIHTYYYVSQYITTRRKQYLKKLEENYKRAAKHQSHEILQNCMRSLAYDFNMELEFELK